MMIVFFQLQIQIKCRPLGILIIVLPIDQTLVD